MGTTGSAPAGTPAALFGVAAASSTDVLAVGGYNPGRQPTALLTNPYAEHWNGHGWAATPVPPLAHSLLGQLNGVTEPTPGDGWAVGTASGPTEFGSESLAYHWDGTAWTRSLTPDPAGPAQENALSAVAARAGNDVWAVGGDAPYPKPQASLVLHYNGSTWAQVSVPNIGALTPTRATTQVIPRFNGQLNAITADPAGHAWAVGWPPSAHTKLPAIITAPGIGQGGIIVAAGASGAGATVTWVGPVTGAGRTNPKGQFAVGGLPDGNYTITASLTGCHPGIATAQVTAGVAAAVTAAITC